ncbi:MAG TPA: hypothetical protein DCY06_13960 [Bacteroidetes bacterium]|nr:hypothetical protein [Bacteroidota bacterium]
MNVVDLEKWGISIINKVKAERVAFSDEPLEFSIFYSPIQLAPRLMIIGDNPGGQLGEQGLYEIPKLHEYIDPNQNYSIAVAMRDKIMKGEKLKDILTNSVKINRIFFRTPNMGTFESLKNANEMKEYCLSTVNEIIETLKPKRILAESFGTFKTFCTTWTSILDKENTKKSLLLAGQYKGIEVLGINHPSQAWRQRIDNKDWERVNKELEKRLD